jgi:hypothetical protein
LQKELGQVSHWPRGSRISSWREVFGKTIKRWDNGGSFCITVLLEPVIRLRFN